MWKLPESWLKVITYEVDNTPISKSIGVKEEEDLLEWHKDN